MKQKVPWIKKEWKDIPAEAVCPYCAQVVPVTGTEVGYTAALSVHSEPTGEECGGSLTAARPMTSLQREYVTLVAGPMEEKLKKACIIAAMQMTDSELRYIVLKEKDRVSRTDDRRKER